MLRGVLRVNRDALRASLFRFLCEDVESEDVEKLRPSRIVRALGKRCAGDPSDVHGSGISAAVLLFLLFRRCWLLVSGDEERFEPEIYPNHRFFICGVRSLPNTADEDDVTRSRGYVLQIRS